MDKTQAVTACVVLLFCAVQVYEARVYETSDSVVVEAAGYHNSNKRSAESASPKSCLTREGKQGTCRSIRDCYPNTKLSELSDLETWVVGTKSTCYYTTPNGRQVYEICCEGFRREQVVTEPESIVVQALDSKQYSQCGAGPKSVASFSDQIAKIVNGEEAAPNSWPFIVPLLNNGRQFCGGSLIDNIHVLTAAHCVAHMSSWDVARLSVALSVHTIKPLDSQSSSYKVRRVTRHKSFDSRTLYNDVAILTLESAVQFSPKVSPICLPSASDSNSYVNRDTVVMGWGTLREGGSQASKLMQVTVSVQPNDVCKKNYGSNAPGGIIDTMLCAAAPGKDSCQGDSGGPLVIKNGDSWTQVGIVSWGIGCAQNPYAGVYTRVTSFMNWITNNLQ
jgi:V8-like Glu-specific endopeptidase